MLPTPMQLENREEPGNKASSSASHVRQPAHSTTVYVVYTVNIAFLFAGWPRRLTTVRTL